MASNIEIKARVDHPEALRQRAEALADGPGSTILQEDVFFHVPQGRLKLRILAPDRGELIYYERADSAEAKRSDYLIATTNDPAALRATLAAALGLRGTVRKTRDLLLVGQTRIHLDRVDGLGDFLELEVVLRPGQPEAEGVAVAAALMEALRIAPEDLIEGAYVDLLEAHAGDAQLGEPAE